MNIFKNYHHYNGSTLLIGAILYAVQIYSDFSGYSDIAIGTARLFNFDLMRNFAYPYFARNIAEFWRRWHISLTNWLTDYIFLPLQMKYRDLEFWEYNRNHFNLSYLRIMAWCKLDIY